MKLLLTLAAVSALPFAAHAASFDCRLASAPDEVAICADPRLSEMDDLVASAYAEARQYPDPDKDAVPLARELLAERRACGPDRTCILARQISALETFRTMGADTNLPAWLSATVLTGGVAPRRSALPTRLGQCATTQVADIMPRLDPGRPPVPADFETGTAVDFANGGHQVSYERESALLQSRPGDPVVMCLVSVPRHCPPGDDRGRFYLVTNLRTNRTWSLPDSQHMCGGA